MLGRLSPMLLISTSVGGGLLIAKYGFREIRVSSILQDKISDIDWLRDRNPEAFKLDKTGNNQVGYAWKTGSEGDVFKDDTYYVFQDWSWLDGVKIGSAQGQSFDGGKRLKNYISGIGFKALNIKDIEKWESNQWERKRDIKLKRVLLSNYEGYYYGGGYKVFDKTSCLLKTSKDKATSGPQIYLIIGWATGGSKWDISKRPESFKLSNGHLSFCDWYAQGYYRDKSKHEINVSFTLSDGKTITGKEFPVIADHRSFVPLYFETAQKQIIHPIILGVAIKGHMKGEVGKGAGERLTKEEATKIIRGKIGNEIVGIYPKENKNNMVGFKLKENGGKQLKGERTEDDDWSASATFKYQYN